MRTTRLLATRPQRVKAGIALGSMVPRRRDVPCDKCNGSGKKHKGSDRFKNHKSECGCLACKPCTDCGGTGKVEAGPRARQVRSPEVLDPPDPEEVDD